MARQGRILAGHKSEFPFGRKKMVESEMGNILVANTGGELFAVSNTCPHAGGYLNYGPLEGYIIECPLHYWPFDLRTGCLVGMEDSGEDARLNTYPVVVEGEEVYIQLPD